MADNDSMIIKCPACGCEMEKVYMPDANVFLDVCVNGCGGIYFDNREFDKFDEPHEDITPLKKVLDNKQFKSVDTTAERICPVCGNIMVKNYASSRHQVQVDECYHCGGKFLDHGELNFIRSQYTTSKERTEDVIKELKAAVGMDLENFGEVYQNNVVLHPQRTSIIKRFVKWLLNK